MSFAAVDPAAHSDFADFRRRFLRNRSAMVGGVIVALVVLAASAAPWIAPHPHAATNMAFVWEPPGGDFALGADALGRDVLSRLLMGARVSLTVALSVLAITLPLGTLVGLVAAWNGGWIDAVTMRAANVTFAFPELIVAILLAALIGPGIATIVLSLAIVGWPGIARITRSLALSLKAEPFVDSAVVSATPAWRILARHILPNIAPALIVRASVGIGFVIMAEATLSFLGLGVQEPLPSWGGMIRDGLPALRSEPHLALAASAVLGLAIIGFNLLGDGLRDLLDPRIPGTMTEAVLRVDDLAVAFPDGSGAARRVVDGVGFAIGRGEILGLAGESGSGKSLTALAVMRLLPQGARLTAASVAFLGHELAMASDADMRGIRGRDMAMVFQEPLTSLNPLLRCGFQIGEVLEAHRGIARRQARARAVDLLRLVGIPSAAARVDDYPHQLSGGMRQRVMIAMAMACEPKLLIADEPTTALDVSVQAQILALIRSLRDRTGMAVLIITHDLGVLSVLADRIMVMYAGEIVESAPAKSLFAQALHPYTDLLVRSAPRLARKAARLDQLAGAPPADGARIPGCRFHPRCPMAIDHCRSERPSLAAIAPDRLSRCWRAGELAARSA